jgi:putative transposase
VVWNDTFAICKQSQKLPCDNDLQKLFITQVKKTEQRGWLEDVYNIPLPQLVADLGVAYKNFIIVSKWGNLERIYTVTSSRR